MVFLLLTAILNSLFWISWFLVIGSWVVFSNLVRYCVVIFNINFSFWQPSWAFDFEFPVFSDRILGLSPNLVGKCVLTFDHRHDHFWFWPLSWTSQFWTMGSWNFFQAWSLDFLGHLMETFSLLNAKLAPYIPTFSNFMRLGSVNY